MRKISLLNLTAQLVLPLYFAAIIVAGCSVWLAVERRGIGVFSLLDNAREERAVQRQMEKIREWKTRN